MNNEQSNLLMKEFLEEMCPIEHKEAFVKFLDNNDPKGFKQLLDKLTKEGTLT